MRVMHMRILRTLYAIAVLSGIFRAIETRMASTNADDAIVKMRGYDTFVSRAMACQPMSRRQKPSGQSILSTAS